MAFKLQSNSVYLFSKNLFRKEIFVMPIRGKKNPRIFPRAKTKLFTIRQPTPQEPVETELLKIWWKQYRMEFNSMLKLYKYEHTQLERAKLEAMKRDDIVEHKNKMTINDAWNEKTRIDREVYMRENFERMTESKRLAHMSQDEKKTLRVAQLQSKLDAYVVDIKSMITEENMDEKIEEILNSDVVNYDFALSPNGTILRGDSSLDNTPPDGHGPSSEDTTGELSRNKKELSVEV